MIQQSPPTNHKLKKALAALLVVGVAIFGFVKYQNNAALAKLTPHLKSTSIRVTNAAEIDMDAANLVPPIERSIKAQIDLEEIDKMLFQIQSAEASKNTAGVITQLKNSQYVIRSLIRKQQKEAALFAAIDFHKRRPSSPIDDVKIAEIEYDSAFLNIRTALEKLHNSNAELAKTTPPDVLIAPLLIETLAKANAGPKFTLTYSDNQ